MNGDVGVIFRDTLSYYNLIRVNTDGLWKYPNIYIGSFETSCGEHRLIVTGVDEL
jgi:hypothetical protein